MAIPDFQTLMLPVLRLMAGGEVSTAKAIGTLSDEFSLSAEERLELIPSKRQGKMANRVHWAITYLSKAGLIIRRGRGRYAITEDGLQVLREPPERITINFLGKFDAFAQFRAARKKNGEAVVSETEVPSEAPTPEEVLESAYNQIIASLETDVLERVLNVSPRAFEQLILDLMEAMQYGTKGSLQHLGRGGDGGFDGIVSEDALGLDVVYLQAKRYARDNPIGVEKFASLPEPSTTSVQQRAYSSRPVDLRNPRRILLPVAASELFLLMARNWRGCWSGTT